MTDPRDGPSHPLCLLALAVLVVNDHVLKAIVPGVVTGKLSDVAWIVVAPVVVAAVARHLGVRGPTARWAGVAGAGGAFVVLQLWAPLGDTWVAVFGGRHVADPADLLALPAVGLVPMCWRPTRRRRWALPFAAFGCLATDTQPCAPTRVPAADEVGWSPTEPLVLGVGNDGARADTAGIVEAIHLRAVDGPELAVVVAASANQFVVCPVGGLEPDTEYEWTVDAWGSSYNHVDPTPVVTGTTTFRTGARIVTAPPVFDQAGCERRAESHSRVCDPSTTRSTVDTGAPP